MPIPGFFVTKTDFGVTGKDGKTVFHSTMLDGTEIKSVFFQDKGFQLNFPNGWTLSVMFGYGNYCENRHNQILFSLLGRPVPDGFWIASDDTEIADFPTDDGDFTMREPRGWCPPEEFERKFNEVAQRTMYVKQQAELIEA
jgi:hypothetical protein